MARQLRLKLQSERLASLDEFARGASNTRAAVAVESWPDWIGGCLAIIGPQGSGKSHLARAWAVATGAHVVDGNSGYVSRIGNRPILIEDADQGVADETLFHLINVAARPGGGLLLTARSRPAAWTTDLPDLRSRLNALPVVEIDAPDDVVLEGVLRKFFRDRNIRPPEEVYPYLLTRMNRSIPEAQEIVRRLDEAGDDGFRPITRMLARQILEENQQLDF
ncbi:chromosomal replication initiator DnaA [Phenylobacterium sp.]|jgi:chromosomal replication initiation ATPase DnaA|uniref:chromosomal replication initiator DnaA n=1 Tax=Phenylobacterium sp. TaxID=1871053 RepID=UPI0037CC7EDC